MSADYKDTIHLPKTDFPMRANLPEREPALLARWQEIGLWRLLREQSRGREPFILHDGPPYANGHLHIGHALNKILKDVINRSQQMLGRDANYVPGWDCHGLPIEWKIEENYRAAGRDKDEVPIVEFRRECREFAQHWIEVQRGEFERMGVIGDWENPYTTMAYAAEAQIARELHAFAENGLLYRGSKPVLWSVVEKTALAEAEVEYEDFVSDQIWAKFPIARVEGGNSALGEAAVAVWTTTPWTIPGNRALAFSPKVSYGLYRVTEAPEGNWTGVGVALVLADTLAEAVLGAARVDAYERLDDVNPASIVSCRHPLADTHAGYGFDVPMLAGDHVTEDAGTGFVHTAPGHGREDFELWIANRARLEALNIDTAIPYTVDADGAFTADAPGFTGCRVFTDAGDKGDANEAVIAGLRAAGMLLARSRLNHQYPHSWRSKKPLLFRNTPQWFIALDKPIDGAGETLRARALAAIKATRWVPASGENRITGMIESRPDWVISRQRAWGVPIPVFVEKKSGEMLRDSRVNARIADAFEAEGADAWFAGPVERFLGPDYDPAAYEQVRDVVDVWFDSGSTHAFVLEQRPDLRWPASLYLEGSDQHRGWFHSSLLEACGTRGRAPYEAVLTHGFVMAEDGRKMSKSLGNVVVPQEVIDSHGAETLRLWVVASDYSEDLKIGPEIIKHLSDGYRRLRNTLRWLLGNLADFDDGHRVPLAEMPELERLILHRLWQLDRQVRAACEAYDFHRIFRDLHDFCAVDLSAFYFDIRKDALYCDPTDGRRRRAAQNVLESLFSCLTAWFAPILCFTAEEAWLARTGEAAGNSVHLRTFPVLPETWRDDELAAKWTRIRAVRRVVTGALEVARADRRLGSSLQAAPSVYMTAADADALLGVDLAEVCITSALEVVVGAPPGEAFVLADVPDVGTVVRAADGERCDRCWRVLPDVDSEPAVPGVCVRCADAVQARQAAA